MKLHFCKYLTIALLTCAASASAEQVTLFSDNMENGTNGWTASGSTNGIDEGASFWHRSSAEYSSSSHSWWYGDPGIGGYPSETDTWGFLQSPAINLTNVTNAQLTVQMSIAYENQYPFWDDSATLYIHDGTDWVPEVGFYWQGYCCLGGWHTVTVNLTPYIGQTIRVGFGIYTGAGCLNPDFTECEYLEPGAGWFVDDVVVTGNR
jgi:hypothetical protein